jgi:ABC-2 type transport system ATP-binding protein
MSTPSIHVDGIHFAYGDREAVKGISFDVQPGEILGFLGPNGAGKSTTIKMLTGLLRPSSGKVEILGHDMAVTGPDARTSIGVCFEEKNLYDNMSGLENLEFFASLFGLKDVDCQAALERVGLGDRSRDRVKNYSKGMRQRAMIARSFINQPKVLFLDEPTDGLDPISSAAIRATIKEEAERGAAVLLTTHDMHEADELSDRLAFINEGLIVAMDTPENLKIEYGKRAVRVRMRGDDGPTEHTVDLGDADAGARLAEMVGSERLLTVHTEEASLESIFIQLTGRGLAG